MTAPSDAAVAPPIETTGAPPPGPALRPGAAWRVLLAIGTGTALSLMGDAALYAVLPTHTAAAGVSLASVGILLSANRWVRLPLNGLLGALYDRSRRRWLFTLALFIGAASTALYAFTTGFWPLLIGRLLWGLAWSGIWVGGNTIILDVTSAHNRGRLTGLYQLSFYLGATLGFPVGGLLTDWLDYHQALMVATAVTAVGAVFTLITLPETRGWHRNEPAAGTAGQQAAANEPAPAITDDASALNIAAAAGKARRVSQISATLLYGGNRFVVAGVISATLALLVQERWSDVRMGTDQALVGVATISGLLLGLSTLISMFSAPLAGAWSDRLGNRWGVAARGLVPGVVGLALLALGQPLLIVPGVVLSALAAGSNQSLATALLGDVTLRERRGRALGSMHTFGDLCSAVAPPLAYAVLPCLGLAGIYAACALLLAIMLAWAIRQGRHGPG